MSPRQECRWRMFAFAYTARSLYAFEASTDDVAYRHSIAANVYLQAMFMCRPRALRREVEYERRKVEAAMIELGYFPLAA